jgi:hypothetical protein
MTKAYRGVVDRSSLDHSVRPQQERLGVVIPTQRAAPR